MHIYAEGSKDKESGNTGTQQKAWLITADMGYGHQRAIYPLKSIGYEEIISVGNNPSTPSVERKLWKRILSIYELLSRAKGIPFIGSLLFKILDFFLHIPTYYPISDLSRSTFQVKLLASSIRQGLCRGMTEKIKEADIPLVTSFYAPAIAADMAGHSKIYCIICDTDLNRVWVSNDPWESRIEYFAPCGKAACRLKAYGVPEQQIHLTGFPLPPELLGDQSLNILKKNLGQRLHYLDPNNRFWPLHQRNIEHFLGEGNCQFKNDRLLTITYAVGGAGAQKEIGKKVAHSLRHKLLDNQLMLNLVAGIRTDVQDYFLDLKEEINSQNINVVYGKDIQEYFHNFNQVLKETDILWSKPSELVFYCGLGIPFIMTPTIGSQEKSNKKWLRELQAGFKQDNPDYADQWLFDLLNKGRLAEAAWAGFLKARKKGTFKIINILNNGSYSYHNDIIR
jgi:hypothetical protein